MARVKAGKQASMPEQTLPVGGLGMKFVGRGSEYFRIWIADMLCMMLTFGLYWPWLRRRRWQYLDANTWVGSHRMSRLSHIPDSRIWPTWRQQLVVGMVIVGLWLFVTRPMGIVGWPMLVILFGMTGPWWLYTAWRARLELLFWKGHSPEFTGRLQTAGLVWLRMCLPWVPVLMFAAALFLDNVRLWLLGGSWTARYGLTDDLRALIPWAGALLSAFALANWFYAAARFGLEHIRHPLGVVRSHLRFWPLLRAALVALVMILPAPFLAIGLVYANWPVLLSLLSIEPPGTLQNLSNLAPDPDSLFGSLRLDVSVLDGHVLAGAGLCVTCRASLVLILLVGCALMMMMGWRYFSARLWNCGWNTFQIAGYAFEGHLAAGRLMATGFFCDLLSLLTFGLYYPYGVIRLARLRRESVRVLSFTETLEGVDGVFVPRSVAVVEPRTHWGLALGLLLLPWVLLVWAVLYGKPVLSEVLVRSMPPALDKALGHAAMDALWSAGVQPSALSAMSQAQLRAGLQEAVLKAWPASVLPEYRIEFVKGGSVLGPNAVALPGNIILLTDELLTLAARQPAHTAVLIGVMGHEITHVIHQDPQRILLLASLTKSVRMVLTGYGMADLLASGVDTVLYQGYGAGVQQAADQGSIHMLRANGLSPEVMVPFLRALQSARFDNPAWMAAAQRVPISLSAQATDPLRLKRFCRNQICP